MGDSPSLACGERNASSVFNELERLRGCMMSHFFAYLSRMRFIRRWGLMHSTHPENIQEHSLRVAMIAHTLAVIRNRMFGGTLNAERLAVRALYHDASEVLTGDLPRPVKYFDPEIETSYRRIEALARAR